MKGQACFMFLNPQYEVGPSICSSVVLCSFVLLVYIVVLVLVLYLCPSSVRVVATFPGIALFPLVFYIYIYLYIYIYIYLFIYGLRVTGNSSGSVQHTTLYNS